MSYKVLGTTVLVLLMFCAAPVASAETTPAKAGGMKVESGQPKAPKMTKTAKPTKTADASGHTYPKHMFDDARHCLDLPTIAEIVKCAEPYRY